MFAIFFLHVDKFYYVLQCSNNYKQKQIIIINIIILTNDMDSRTVLQMSTSYIAIQGDLPVTLGILTNELWVSKLLHSKKDHKLRTVPTIVTAHTFGASRDTRVSYGWCLLIEE